MRYIEFIVLEDRNRLFGQPKTADISQSFQGQEARGSLAESLTPPEASGSSCKLTHTAPRRRLGSVPPPPPHSVNLFIDSQDMATASPWAQTDPGPLLAWPTQA